MARERRQNDFSGLALLAGGVVLVTMSLGGYAIGAIIDARMHSSPIGAIIGLIIGTLIGFWDLYRIATRVMRGQPVPTREQQDAAKVMWEKSEISENSDNSEGDRDKSHE